MKNLRNLTKSPEDLSGKEIIDSVAAATQVAFFIAIVALLGAVVFSWLPIGQEHPLFLVQAQVKLTLGHLLLGVLRYIAVVAFGLLACQFLENSPFGSRVGDRKMLYAALILAAALVFGGGPQ